MDNLLLRLDWICEVSGIALTVCWKDAENSIQKQSLREEAISDFFAENAILDFQLQKRTMENPIIMTFEPGFLVGILQAAENQYIIVGPAPIGVLRQEDIYKQCGNLFAPDAMPMLCDALMHTPVYSVRKFIKLMLMVQYQASGVQGTIDFLVNGNSLVSVEQIPVLQNQSLYQGREDITQHASIKWEQSILAAVESGDTDKLKKLITNPMPGKAGIMSANPLQQSKYIFISFTALVTRAAIRGGISQETAFSLSDVYCQHMDSLTDPQEVYTLLFKVAMDFSTQVKNAGWRKDLSVPIRMCCEYIGRHLHESISLDDLSQHCGLCSRRISSRFKNETGLSVPNYIHNERMKEATYLLAFSTKSLGEISEILQYTSQSYFTKKFRELFGVTPQAYRDSKK